MSGSGAEEYEIEKLLKELFEPQNNPRPQSLKELFEERLNSLGMSNSQACDVLGIQTRALNGIISGSAKMIDPINIIKLSNFVQIPKERVFALFIEQYDKNFPQEQKNSGDKVEFIKNNFDLAVLKKAGFIKSISDFQHIEERITFYFGLKSIFDYKRPSIDVAFSAGKRQPKNPLTRSTWIASAIELFSEIKNPNPYDRQELIQYFPKIRWHSTNVELGFQSVIKDLYKIGVTVAYHPPLPTLHLRGATFSIYDKPCVVVTDYSHFYPSLWFTLVHELFHVLFDWEEIRIHEYHLSDEESEQLTIREKENEADSFAREFLLSKDKTSQASKFIFNENLVDQYAKANHVHPSFIYVFHAFDSGSSSSNRLNYGRARINNPDYSAIIAPFLNEWDNLVPVQDFAKSLKNKIYNK